MTRAPRLRRWLRLALATAIGSLGFLVVGTGPTSAAPECVEGVIACGFTVPATAGGPVANGGTGPFGTGIVLGPGKTGYISGSPGGSIFLGGANPPVDEAGGIGPAPATALVPGALYGCLAVRVGDSPWRCVYPDGTNLSGVGEVQFGINDDPEGNGGNGYGDNTGSFHVGVTLERGWVTFEKVLVGDDPGIAFPIVVTCTSDDALSATVPTTGEGAELVLGPGQTKSTTMFLRPNDSQTFEVWWPPSATGARCTWAEDLSVVPPGFSCSSDPPTHSGFNFWELKYLGIGTVTFTNTCVAAIVTDPRFTG